MWMLAIGLAWLSVTGVACLLIGRAIRKADVRDEELALLQRAGLPRTSAVRGHRLYQRRLIMPPAEEPRSSSDDHS